MHVGASEPLLLCAARSSCGSPQFHPSSLLPASGGGLGKEGGTHVELGFQDSCFLQHGAGVGQEWLWDSLCTCISRGQRQCYVGFSSQLLLQQRSQRVQGGRAEIKSWKEKPHCSHYPWLSKGLGLPLQPGTAVEVGTSGEASAKGSNAQEWGKGQD